MKFWLLTPTESGSEASNFEDYLEEEEEEDQQQQQASAEIKTQAATSGRLPTWRLPQGPRSIGGWEWTETDHSVSTT